MQMIHAVGVAKSSKRTVAQEAVWRVQVQGHRQARVARDLGISRQRVNQIIKRHDRRSKAA